MNSAVLAWWWFEFDCIIFRVDDSPKREATPMRTAWFRAESANVRTSTCDFVPCRILSVTHTLAAVIFAMASRCS